MSSGNPWNIAESSLKLAIQTDLTTPNGTSGDYRVIACESPSLTFDTRMTELDLLTGQPGAAAKKVFGARSGKITFNVPLEALKDGYSPTTEQPGSTGVLPMWFCLASNMMGCDIENLAGGTLSIQNTNFWDGTFVSNNGGYAADDVASATDTIVTMDAASGANYDAGDFLITGVGTGATTLQAGFVKSVTGDALTLFEASGSTVNDNAAEAFGTATAYISSHQPRPLTAHYVGSSSAAYGYILTGLVGESFKIGLDSGDTPVIEFSFTFADFQADSTIGGLSVPTSYPTIAPLVGDVGGRATLAGALACGLESVTFELACTLASRKCHSAPQGVYATNVTRKKVTLGLSVPHHSTDGIYTAIGSGATTGDHKWQSYMQRGVSQSVAIYAGSGVGTSFAALIPSGQVASVALTEMDGELGYQLSIEAGAYTGDGASTGAGNSSARLALG